MGNHLWQRDLRRSKSANRIGVALMVALILVLLVSVVNGLLSLGV
jgi:hypothetical protein